MLVGEGGRSQCADQGASTAVLVLIAVTRSLGFDLFVIDCCCCCCRLQCHSWCLCEALGGGGIEEICRLLLDHGARTDIKDNVRCQHMYCAKPYRITAYECMFTCDGCLCVMHVAGGVPPPHGGQSRQLRAYQATAGEGSQPKFVRHCET